MIWLRIILLTCLGLGVSLPALAAEELLHFDNPAQEQRFQVLVEELRCPKCQNQNLSDSNSTIATDLRDQVYRMVVRGDSNEQIVNYMVARYGEFVLYKPTQKPSTFLLWYGPFILLGIGAVIFVVVISLNKRKKGKA
ncbi:cytochrome c-type biogenesis protein CcmH [Maribrevibacterium harenarium]|uniref:Cytochrome c-type biogenesis protein n=1 Tax=Maribrevibacterium harenarium TaxID=2589817 RepID=A0A501X2P7_9GAMM|nr:cytochrome c-type biogenesis protein [Maribrevibacterium harenarium]TPE54734.1 cytochrome c-type biogenesis protein CcmH [Maribrevibacterium harenarium]